MQPYDICSWAVAAVIIVERDVLLMKLKTPCTRSNTKGSGYRVKAWGWSRKKGGVWEPQFTPELKTQKRNNPTPALLIYSILGYLFSPPVTKTDSKPSAVKLLACQVFIVLSADATVLVTLSSTLKQTFRHSLPVRIHTSDPLVCIPSLFHSIFIRTRIILTAHDVRYLTLKRLPLVLQKTSVKSEAKLPSIHIHHSTTRFVWVSGRQNWWTDCLLLVEHVVWRLLLKQLEIISVERDHSNNTRMDSESVDLLVRMILAKEVKVAAISVLP